MDRRCQSGLSPKVEKIIERNVLYATLTSLIPIPIIDFASTLALQISMIKVLAGEYGITGEDYQRHKVKSIIGSLAGNISALGIIKIIPGFGHFLGAGTMAVSSAASTYALGRVFAVHFAAGGTILDFNPEKTRQYYFDELQKAEKSKDKNQA